MFDRRVIRGNTYSIQNETSNAQSEAERIRQQHQLEKRKKEKMRNKAGSQKPSTPDAVPGRKHIEVQTGLYLEELTDKVPEESATTQTEPFLDRPPSPLFLPAKVYTHSN